MTFTKRPFAPGTFAIGVLALSAIGLLPTGCGQAPTALGSKDTIPAADGQGPVRMARVSEVTGKVSWRPDATTGWGAVTLNLPIRQGAEVWLAPQSRLEVQFDDGSTVHLGNGAVATLQTLYSDPKGEYTEVKLAAGTSSWKLKEKDSIYQVDAPNDSVKSFGPSDFRVDIDPKADSLAVRGGDAILSAQGTDTPISTGHAVVLDSPQSPVVQQTIGPEDNWDHYSDNRDALLSEAPEHVPPDIAIVSGGLNRHGRWHNDPDAGWVWTPTVEAGWRPYHHGHWAWVDPYGWTWVSSEPWGWAPYHYGTWKHFGYGWGWAPGPAVQYWSPARVDFAEDNGYVSWAPLAPEEVSYPAFSVGFGGANWAVNFSIGGCAVYEPYGADICNPVPYPWGYYNDPSHRDGWNSNGWGQNRFEPNSNHFIPRNAEFGADRVTDRGFGGNGQFAAINGNATGTFRAGSQAVANRQAFSGPVNVRPNRNAFTPGQAVYASAGPAALNRSLVRGALPENVARTSGSFGRTVAQRGQPATQSGARTPSSVVAARQSLGFQSPSQGSGGRTQVTRTASTGPGNARTTVTRGTTVTRNTPSGARQIAAARTTVGNGAQRAAAARSNGARQAVAARTNGARQAAAARTNGARQAAVARTNGARQAAVARTNGARRAPATRTTATANRRTTTSHATRTTVTRTNQRPPQRTSSARSQSQRSRPQPATRAQAPARRQAPPRSQNTNRGGGSQPKQSSGARGGNNRGGGSAPKQAGGNKGGGPANKGGGGDKDKKKGG